MNSTLSAEQRKAKRDLLINNRGQIKGRITRLTNYLTKSGPHADVALTEKNLQRIQEDYLQIPVIQENLIELEPEVNHEEIGEGLEYDYADLLVLVSKLKSPTPPTDGNTHGGARPQSTVSHGSNTDYITKIPMIELKKFDGALEKWRAYRDWFISTIHNRDGLSDANRLDYLQATLTGEAAKTIEAFESTDSNYAEAWKLLEQTYDNARVLILRHFTVLLETPSMKKNSAEEIRTLLNRVQTHILALKALGEKVEEWNTPLVHLIYTRLDEDTAREWNRKLEGTRMPKYEDLITFLREEATRIAPMTISTANKTPQTSGQPNRTKSGGGKGNGQHAHAFVTTTESACCMYNEAHKLVQCDKFLALTTPLRIQTARDASLCLNCLKGRHKTRLCRANVTCETCKKKHNSLLHLNDEELRGTASQSQAPQSANHTA